MNESGSAKRRRLMTPVVAPVVSNRLSSAGSRDDRDTRRRRSRGESRGSRSHRSDHVRSRSHRGSGRSRSRRRHNERTHSRCGGRSRNRRGSRSRRGSDRSSSGCSRSSRSGRKRQSRPLSRHGSQRYRQLLNTSNNVQKSRNYVDDAVPPPNNEVEDQAPNYNLAHTRNPVDLRTPITLSKDCGTQDIASAFRDFIQIIKSEGNSKQAERFPVINNAVPEFDPAKRNQTIDMWITKVNECASIYNWSQRETIHYALPKLAGLAQRWYQGLPSVLFSWDEWQGKLRSAFPSTENYGQLLHEMLNCKAKFGDPLEDYFYDKTILLNRCKISGKEAVDCILFGIDDRSVRTGAEAVQYTDPDKLLVYLRSVKSIKRPEKLFHKTPAPDRAVRPGIIPKSDFKAMKCYNCGEEGHPSFRCKQPLKKCELCFKLGHLGTGCPNRKNAGPKPEEKSVLFITNKDNKDSKYFKKALINSEEITCFIDMGSQCTMMRESEANRIIKLWNVDNLPLLKGFGDGKVRAIGKCLVNVSIDSVGADTLVLIVPDNTLNIPLLVGQSFTEQDHITITKTSDSLQIASKNHCKDKILLYVSQDSIIRGLCEVDVYTQPIFDGDLIIEQKLRQEPRKEYEILRGYCNVKNGKGKLVMRGFSHREFMIPKDSLVLRTYPADILNVNLIEDRHYDTQKLTNPTLRKEHINREDISVDDQTDKETVSELLNLLNEFRDCFAFSTPEIGCTKATEMEIHLSDRTPVVYRPYRLSHSQRESARKIVNDLESCGIIRESHSDYASPIVLVKKKSGEDRMCIDYRALNKRTVKEHYPIPRIEDQIDNLSGNKYYTSLDLASGYYQVPVSESSKHLTAFVTPDGHYEFNRMPFGLANAPSTFQRTINKVLGNARFQHAFAYMDDVIIPSLDTDIGLKHLRSVLVLFREAGLTLNLSKCHFFMRNIEYLGFEINADGVKPGSRKIDAVKNFPRPSDQHTVRQFIGLASYFRRFVEKFSLIAKPLTQLLKKDSKWQWGEVEENAFVTLRKMLVERPVLAFYNPTFETQVHTDASKTGIGGILLQREKPCLPFKAVAYYSRQTSPEEQHYTSYDLETLAVVCSLQRFRVYLLGLHFKVVTDCNSLRATFEKKDMIPRVARWWNAMQEYDFEMEYRPGVSMAHVDALSRNPISTSNLTSDLSSSEHEVRQITVDWVATVQQNDPEIRRTIEMVNDKNLDSVLDAKTNFVVKRGLLYRKTDDGDRWVVPKGVRWHILKANHDEIGHFSFDKTFQKVKSDYWWPKMRRTIKKYVSSCLECAHAKGEGGKKAGELHPIPKIDCPFHTIHFDHLGPFVRSRKKNSYLFVIIEAFTKFIVLVPVKNTKASTSINALRHYIHLFGVPKRIISDRGSGFTSKQFQSYLSSLGVKHILNAVATPRANGQVERYNRTILGALTAANHGKPENIWDEKVSEVQWGLNNTINQGTGKTPAQGLFGMQLIGEGDASLRASIDLDEDRSVVDLQTIRKEVSEHIEKNQANQKKRYDRHRKRVTFNVGDLVRIEREIPATGQSRKLIPRYQGPYRVTQVINNDRYEIRDTPISRKNNRPFKSIVSVDKMFPWLVFNRDSGDSDIDDNYSDNDDINGEATTNDNDTIVH